MRDREPVTVLQVVQAIKLEFVINQKRGSMAVAPVPCLR
jgi:hypothetical protein